MLGYASTPPSFSHAALIAVKVGCTEMLKPP
jgi:hypothetical protein